MSQASVAVDAFEHNGFRVKVCGVEQAVCRIAEGIRACTTVSKESAEQVIALVKLYMRESEGVELSSVVFSRDDYLFIGAFIAEDEMGCDRCLSIMHKDGATIKCIGTRFENMVLSTLVGAFTVSDDGVKFIADEASTIMKGNFQRPVVAAVSKVSQSEYRFMFISTGIETSHGVP